MYIHDLYKIYMEIIWIDNTDSYGCEWILYGCAFVYNHPEVGRMWDCETDSIFFCHVLISSYFCLLYL